MHRIVRSTFFSISLLSGMFVGGLADNAFAQTVPATDSAPAEPSSVQSSSPLDLDTVVISGRYPGPGLWKVRNGERTLWILGTQNPLPKRMEWDSANVERKVAAAQELLMPPSVNMDADIGFFRGLTLLPSLFKARKNPDGKTLGEVLPAAQYARWQVLKQRYIGGDRGIEEWRPVFAALELYDKAITRSGMTQEAVVSDVVRKAAKRNKVKITTPTVKIKIANAKAALREFSSEALNDQECFQRTLDRIESDLGTMAGRANAWAEGDVQALRSLPYQNQYTACNAVFTGTAIARKQGMEDILLRLENEWMEAAEKSLNQNVSTFAVLPVGQLLKSGGLLERLAAKHYTIEAP
jgi:TraB/PrgY/gumN family